VPFSLHVPKLPRLAFRHTLIAAACSVADVSDDVITGHKVLYELLELFAGCNATVLKGADRGE